MQEKGSIQDGSTTSRILDILETDGMWMSADALEAEFSDRFGEGTLNTIKRSIHRLVNANRIQHRIVLWIDYNASPGPSLRGAQATPSGHRTKQLIEVRTL